MKMVTTTVALVGLAAHHPPGGGPWRKTTRRRSSWRAPAIRMTVGGPDPEQRRTHTAEVAKEAMAEQHEC